MYRPRGSNCSFFGTSGMGGVRGLRRSTAKKASTAMVDEEEDEEEEDENKIE
jgi:hypothetical protein